MRLPVTYLFVAGDRPERFAKALASGADTVILDLEDAVAPERKAQARAACIEWLAARSAAERSRVLVRVNAADSAEFDEDLGLLRASGAAGAMLPKAESVEAVAAVRAALATGGVIVPLVESAGGLERVDDIARCPHVQRLAFGALDYALDLGLSGDERGLLFPMCRIALASRVAGREAPIAGVTAAIDDEAPLLADLAFARACGFAAKLCIHPRQVALVRRAWAPTAAEVDWARRVLAAADAAPGGAVQVDGRMVDRPVLLQARAILERVAQGGSG